MNDAPLAQIVDLAGKGASGELVCEAGETEVHVFLQAGRIAWATDSRHPQAFTRHLKEHARLDPDALEEVAAECRRTHAPMGETLVKWNLVTADQVRTALRSQLVLALEVLAQGGPGAKAVFLSRPRTGRCDPQFTFELRELLPGARAAAVVEKPPALAARGAAAGGRPAEAARATPEAPPTPAPPAPAPEARGSQRRGGARHLVVGVVAAAAVVMVAAGAVRCSRGEPGAARAGAPAAGAASAGAAAELVFGMSAPFSGAVKDLGRAMRTGVEVAFSAANQGGGVNGRTLRLLALDDGYDPARAVQMTQQLVESRGVFGMVGSVGTGGAGAVLPYVLERKVLLFGALTGSPSVRKTPPDRYVFNYRPSYAEETAAAVRYLVDVRRIPPAQIAAFYQDDELGKAALVGVRDQLVRMGEDPARLLSAAYRPNSADVSAAVARIGKESDHIRAVVMMATSQAALQFIQQMKEQAAQLVFTNLSVVDANALSEGLVGAGRGYTSEVVVTQVVPLPTSRSSAALEYQAALAKFTVGEKPDFVTFEGFIVGKLLVEGLRRAGKDPTTESLAAALETIQGLDLGTGAPIGFAPADHQGSHKIWGTQLQPDGSYRAIRLE